MSVPGNTELGNRPSKKRRREKSADLYDEVLAPAAALTDDEESGAKLLKPLTKEELERYNAKADKTGIIYLSRIPPGMGPSQVRHQLGKYGALGRVFLQRDEKGTSRLGKNKRTKHQAHRFFEGWIEFEDKKIARSVADMLTARTIGGPKASPFHDDIWTMKYLPKFKWNMLSEQVALEASTQAALLRNHLAQSKRDQAAYLEQVERARIDAKKADKRAAREGRAEERGEQMPAKTPRKLRDRSYSQRGAIDGSKAQATSKELEDVLANLF